MENIIFYKDNPYLFNIIKIIAFIFDLFLFLNISTIEGKLINIVNYYSEIH